MSHFDSKADAAVLHKAMKGLGTDEKALNSIFGTRTKAQLVDIAKAYESAYKTTLEKDIKGDTSGNYELLLVYMAKPVNHVMADFLKYATKGAGTKEKYITDVLAPSSNKEITDIFHADPTAIGAVTGDVSHGDWAKVVGKMLKGVRDESGKVDESEAEKVAAQLYKAGEGKIGTDEDTFTEILTTRSPAFLKRVSHHYAAKHKHSLEQAIKKETSGDYESILVGLLKTKHEYFADRFYTAVHGAGTDDHFLCYAFGVLSREDLAQIAKIFHEKHSGTTLAKEVAGDVGGHYGDLIKMLLANAH
jgi:hypothetical protein